MPWVTELMYVASHEERAAQLGENARISWELVRLASRDCEDMRDLPRFMLARTKWDAYVWQRDNKSPTREALDLLPAYFVEGQINQMVAGLIAENFGLGTLAVKLFETFRRDALIPAARADLTAEETNSIREAVIALANGLEPIWETLALPDARAAALQAERNAPTEHPEGFEEWKPSAAPPTVKPLRGSDRQRRALQSLEWAVAQRPEFESVAVTTGDNMLPIHQYLTENGCPQFASFPLPGFHTWLRYIRAARPKRANPKLSPPVGRSVIRADQK